MSHIATIGLHGYAKRGLTVVLDIITEVEAADMLTPRFRVAGVEKTGLPVTDTAEGVEIEIDLTADDLDQTPGEYGWEALAAVNGEETTIMAGRFVIDPEPTPAPA